MFVKSQGDWIFLLISGMDAFRHKLKDPHAAKATYTMLYTQKWIPHGVWIFQTLYYNILDLNLIFFLPFCSKWWWYEISKGITFFLLYMGRWAHGHKVVFSCLSPYILQRNCRHQAWDIRWKSKLCCLVIFTQYIV